MIHRPHLQEFLDYKKHPALSHTVIKDVLRGAPSKPSSALATGSIIDAYLTVPDLVDDLFSVAPDMPSEKIREFVESVIQITGPVPMQDAKTEFLSVVREAGFDPNKSEDSLWLSLTNKAMPYWNFLVENIGTGKMVLSHKERSFGYEISQRVKRHPKHGILFTVLPGRETFFQKFLFGEYNGKQIKGALDQVIVNEDKKLVTVIDYKTVYNLSLDLFFQQAREYGYPRQLSFYRELVRQAYPDYTIKCSWLVIPKNMNNFDLNLIECPSSLLDNFKTGYFSSVTGQFVDGWANILEYSGDIKSYHSRQLSPDFVESQF